MGVEVNSEIISLVNKSKFYPGIADCPPDITNIKQLSLKIQFVNLSSDGESISKEAVLYPIK